MKEETAMNHQETIAIEAFDQFDAAALYAMLKFRFDVFILEQRSFYPELDNLDQDALHLTARRGDELVGVLRILPGPQIAVGRVAVRADCRGSGLARRIMRAALARIELDWPDRAVVLGAQQHLEPFYARFGFKTCSDVYDDGGIPHVNMVRV